MPRLGYATLVVLSLGVAAYALAAYGFRPLGAFVHPDMRAVFAANAAAIHTHVFASAVALRLYLPSAMAARIPFELAYPAIAWLCWIPNLLAAEWLLRRTPSAIPVRADAGARRTGA